MFLKNMLIRKESFQSTVALREEMQCKIAKYIITKIERFKEFYLVNFNFKFLFILTLCVI